MEDPADESLWSGLGEVLGDLADLGYDAEWRVLDARYFGVAQRRRRVFIVACPGETDGFSVLFESESRQRRSPSGRSAGTVAPTLPASGAGTSRPGGPRLAEEDEYLIVARSLKASGGFKQDDTHETYIISRPLNAPHSPRLDGESETFVIQDVRSGTRDRTDDGQGIGISDEDVSYTLGAVERHGVAHTLRAEGADASEDGTGRGVPLVVSESGQGWFNESGVTAPIRAEGENRPTRPSTVVMQQLGAMTVRRLTPIECCRLQAFPDDWLDNLGLSDSAKYRMLGNAVCVANVLWIAVRLRAVLNGTDPNSVNAMSTVREHLGSLGWFPTAVPHEEHKQEC